MSYTREQIEIIHRAHTPGWGEAAGRGDLAPAGSAAAKLAVAESAHKRLEWDVVRRAKLSLTVAANTLEVAARDLSGAAVAGLVTDVAAFLRRLVGDLDADHADELRGADRALERLIAALAGDRLAPPDPDTATALARLHEVEGQILLGGSNAAQLALPLIRTLTRLAVRAAYHGEGFAVAVVLPFAESVAFSGTLTRERVAERRLEGAFGWAGYAQMRGAR